MFPSASFIFLSPMPPAQPHLSQPQARIEMKLVVMSPQTRTDSAGAAAVGSFTPTLDDTYWLFELMSIEKSQALFPKAVPSDLPDGRGLKAEDMVIVKNLTERPDARSFKTPRKEKTKLPAPNYKRGEQAWLTINGHSGSYKVVIASDGVWDVTTEQWYFTVRQTDGKLYGEGTPVSEMELDRSKD
ncbi:hypothetical protein B0O99DRAFT_745310 [Bisporella sp. PMI_857]|nr:hypothetical protein B0O99DRAFT_745310 [Bisporella sp. PMI_857]